MHEQQENTLISPCTNREKGHSRPVNIKPRGEKEHINHEIVLIQ